MWPQYGANSVESVASPLPPMIASPRRKKGGWRPAGDGVRVRVEKYGTQADSAGFGVDNV
jgi:hypothetical protein